MNDWGQAESRRGFYRFIGVGLLAVGLYIGYIFFVTYSEKNMMALLDKSYTDFTVKNYINGGESYFRKVSNGNESGSLNLTTDDMESIMSGISSTEVKGVFNYSDIQMENDFAVYLDSSIPSEELIRLYLGRDINTNKLLLTISSTKKTVAYYYEVKNDNLYKVLDELVKEKQAP